MGLKTPELKEALLSMQCTLAKLTMLQCTTGSLLAARVGVLPGAV